MTSSVAAPGPAVRRRLPVERQAVTQRFTIADQKGFLTVGLFEDGTPGEIFLTMAKEGSTLSGFADAFAIAVSMALQHGVPLNVLARHYLNTHFDPCGATNDPQIPRARSIPDYVFRWLSQRFLPSEDQRELGLIS